MGPTFRKLSGMLPILIFMLLGGLTFFTIKRGNLSDWILYQDLKTKEFSSLSTGQKFFLFKQFLQRKDLADALKIGAEFKGSIAELSKAERVYIAGHLGLIFRLSGAHAQELELYNDFFKADYPALYHAFRASAFRSTGDQDTASQELMLAKRIAEGEKDLITLEVLQKVVNEENQVTVTGKRDTQADESDGKKKHSL